MNSNNINIILVFLEEYISYLINWYIMIFSFELRGNANINSKYCTRVSELNKINNEGFWICQHL